MAWQAKSGCPAHLRDVIERFVNDRPAEWRIAPAPRGEVFESFEQCQERLNVWAIAEGFAVVIRGHGNTTACRRFRCIHHGVETRNDRELEDRVVKDSDKNIITKRKRDNTYTSQKACQWYVLCSFKDIEKRGSGTKGYCLTAKELHHSHRLAENPLQYPVNQRLIPEYRQLTATAIKHRIQVVSYSQSRRILESNDLGVFLSKKQYYNLIRNQPVDQRKLETIQGLLQALDEVEFIHHQRVNTEKDHEGKIHRRLVQIWFAHPKQLAIAQRFVADSVLIIDGTFNTNQLVYLCLSL